MTHVYMAEHVQVLEDGTEKTKFIGVFSSPSAARLAIEGLRGLEWLSSLFDTPEGFHIAKCPIDQDHWQQGFVFTGETIAADPAAGEGAS